MVRAAGAREGASQGARDERRSVRGRPVTCRGCAAKGGRIASHCELICRNIDVIGRPYRYSWIVLQRLWVKGCVASGKSIPEGISIR